jgi:phosphonate transport system substrate-binding protein
MFSSFNAFLTMLGSARKQVRRITIALVVLLPLAALDAAAQSCPHRGDLDEMFCDRDKNMVADAPADPAKRKNPPMLLMSYTPQEDNQAYERLWQPYLDHMTQCTGKRTRFFQVHSPAAAVEAMRSGRINLSTLSTGDTPFAVNVAGAVPFAIRGDAKGPTSYHLIVLVKNNSPIKTLEDLAGKRVAHAAPSSNSGNLAPRALFPAEGVTPDKDYKVLYSGKHDASVAGVQSGDYDAAAVADDVYDRMLQRGLVKPNELRVVYRSRPFPNGSMVMAHDLNEELAAKIATCTTSWRFTPELTKAFQGADRFWPLNYAKDFEMVRQVAKFSGQAINSATPAPPKR